MKISASVLIEEMNRSRILSVRELASYIQLKKVEYENCKDSVAMEISISTDDDFSVEGKSEYEKVFSVPKGEDPYKFFMNIWNNLNMVFSDSRKYIKEDFDEILVSSDVKESFKFNMDIYLGGNQTLNVIFVDVPTILSLGDYEIDLTS